MSVNVEELKSLPAAEKMRIVELLWDDLGASDEPIPLPDWIGKEAARRRDEMQDPSFGITHEEAWRRIELRTG